MFGEVSFSKRYLILWVQIQFLTVVDDIFYFYPTITQLLKIHDRKREQTIVVHMQQILHN